MFAKNIKDVEETTMRNPYTLIFGIEPDEYVSRLNQTNMVVNALSDGGQKIFMITGIRGAGKTVFMTDIKATFQEKKDWVVVELSTERDMLESLVKKLSSKDNLMRLFQKARINLSVFGIDMEISGTTPIVDIEVALGEMLSAMKKHRKKLLVFVDEVVDNKTVREFSSVFQILIRDKLPIHLLMTGLFENIDNLQNEKNLTFLHRAPKLHLSPLSIGTMAASYRKNLGVDEEQSIKMAQLTRGYSYAFQVLGYCYFDNGGDYEDAIVQLKQYLEEYVYDKIWSELSEKDKKTAYAIACSQTHQIKEIREMLQMEPNQFAPYKKRLVRKGIIANENGYARFAPPLFDEFVRENYY